MLVAAFSLLVSGFVYAQAPTMEWHRPYGTELEEKPQHGMQTRDGGFLVVGMTGEAPRQRHCDMLIVKTDAKGKEEWQRIIGESKGQDWANMALEVTDGYIIAGALSVKGDQERALLKLDASGKTVWQRTYPHEGADAFRGLTIRDDGSIVATGYVGGEEEGYLFICDSGQVSLMKADPQGAVVWDKTLSSAAHGMRVEEVAAGYAIAANKWVDNRIMDVVLILTDHEGKETFSQNYGEEGDDQCFDFVATSDGGYALAGHSTSYGVHWDFYLLKLDGKGKKLWHKTFGEPRGYDPQYMREECYGLQETPDGGLVIAGGTGDETDQYHGTGHAQGTSSEWKGYVVKTDADGNLLWQGLYGKVGAGHSAAEHINLTRDGGYVLFMDTDIHETPPPNNFGIMKLGPDQASGKIAIATGS
jgi:hypothetical protein